MRARWRQLIITLFTVLSLLPPLFVKQIVDVLIGQGDLSRLVPLIVGLVIVHALSELANSGDQYIRHTVGEKFLDDLRVRIYDHLQRLSLSFFERTSSGELMSRVSNDVNALEQFVTHGTVLTGMAALRLVGAAAVLLVLDWRLALVALLPAPLPRHVLRAEYLIQQALDEVMRGRTALVIAHRLSTIRNAHKIVALEGGRIQEIGRHSELLQRGGLCSQLYQRQLELAGNETQGPVLS